MSSPPTWDSIRTRWPNADASRFVDAGDLRWHVQMAGSGPVVLLLHGSGGANHTWRALLPLLSRQFTVVAPDLPGHGFTTSRAEPRLSLEGMSDSLCELLSTLSLRPAMIAGHSAGGALALWLANEFPECAVAGINAAIAPPHALMTLLTPVTQVLAGTGLVGFLTAKLAESDFAFDSLMSSTGSDVNREQRDLYRAFATSVQHTSALMAMFAAWDLQALVRRLPSVTNRVTLLVGARDGWVSPASTRDVARRLSSVQVVELPDCGHLAHEEQPERIAETLISAMLHPPP